MIKKLACVVLCVLMAFGNIFTFSYAIRGINLNRIKRFSAVYPVTLMIGGMTFDGKLYRGNRLTDEEIEKIIRDTLKDMELTELDVWDLEVFVQRIESVEFTPEQAEEIWNDIKNVGGIFGLIADGIEYIFGDGKSTEQIIADTAGEVAQGRGLKMAAQGMKIGKGAASAVSTGVDGLFVTVDSYEKGQRKWENRKAMWEAKKLLNEIYEKINEKLEQESYKRGQNWTLEIYDHNRASFSFYRTEDNLQEWHVTMILKKEDSFNDLGPGGTYTGTVYIDVEYKMSSFDTNFMEKYCFTKDKNAVIAFNSLREMEGKFHDECEPTKISRTLYSKEDISVEINTGKTPQGTVIVPVDFSGLTDEKEISIRHQVICDIDIYLIDGGRVVQKQVYDFSTKNEERLYLYGDVPVSYVVHPQEGVKHIPKPLEVVEKAIIEWDKSIWEPWEREKQLIIHFDAGDQSG